MGVILSWRRLMASPILVSVMAVTPTGAWAQVDYLSEVEAEIVREHSLARTDPARYAQFLRERRSHYDGNLLVLPGKVPLRTREGIRAVDEAIRFLEGIEPVPGVTAARGMSLAARDHVADQGPQGNTGHEGSDGSQPWDRVSRYGEWLGSVAENVTYGLSEAREVVIGLIVDDGVPDRGHRVNVFDARFQVVGVSCGPHAGFRTMCVITYAGGFREPE